MSINSENFVQIETNLLQINFIDTTLFLKLFLIAFLKIKLYKNYNNINQYIYVSKDNI